ncbi:precorrin-2 dehydrogenase/sirohydrochlorin ferrochelatase family protein [Aquihabitans sp. McL0605]|uniref:precorrin-2 dehydrogenase/sirohydrochlorin ferrochelatase family protein n=1 Tax=Aquihabitans sp. McL0605 TaxID=3415671 RepID=UPI003CE6FAD6
MGARYPVLVDLTGAPCLVVGGGAVATRKVLGLLAAAADVTVLAPALTAPLLALAESDRIRWSQGAYAAVGTAPGGGPWAFAVAATDDVTVNDRVVADARAAGTWVNDVTDPTGGPAAIPATRREGPVTVSVSTGGIHPAAARWLCDQAAQVITPEVLVALDLVEEVRLHDVAAGGTGARPDWRLAVDSGMLDLIREGQLAEAKERLQACLSSSSD